MYCLFLLALYLVTTTASICGKHCDGDDAWSLQSRRVAYTTKLHNRQFSILISDTDNAAFGRITNGEPTDEIWLDRSWDGGKSWRGGSRLCFVLIPKDEHSVDTKVINIDGNDGQTGLVRACGKAGNRDQIVCTKWARHAPADDESRICGKLCDGDDPARLKNPRVAYTVTVHWRQVSILVSGDDKAAVARIANGDPGDEIWIERSWDNGNSWGKDDRLGYRAIPRDSRTADTNVVNLEDFERIGVVRACGKAGNRDDVVCTPGAYSRFISATQICKKHCDGDDSGLLTSRRIASTSTVHNRKVSILVSEKDNAAIARIENGDPTDEVWIDRSWDAGQSWDDGSRLGFTVIPKGERTVDTSIYNIDGIPGSNQFGMVRACGKAGNRDELTCTPWTRATPPAAIVRICKRLCDGDDPRRLANPRKTETAKVFGREISVILSDSDVAAIARIANGWPNDEVWLDRSWNAGKSWEVGSKLGYRAIPQKARSVETTVFNVDGNLQDGQIGVIRACGKAGNRIEIACTPWIRPPQKSSGNPSKDEVGQVLKEFIKRGQYDNSSCLKASIDYTSGGGERDVVGFKIGCEQL